MKSINIRHFRCFEELSLSFGSGINLLIGDNASGKTSLLKACKYVLSAFFVGYSDENTRWLGFEADDYMERRHGEMVLPDMPIEIAFDVNDYFVGDAMLRNTYLKKVSRKNSRMLLEGLKEYKAFVSNIHNSLFDSETNQSQALPLFAYFSTEDIHSTRKLNSAKFKTYNQKNSFGYYECLTGNGLFTYWLKRLSVLQEGGKNLQEVAVVKRAVVDVLGREGCCIIEDMDIRPQQSNVYFLLSDGREVKADYLSDGYRRVVNIVIDLAFRCALLNRMYFGEGCCRQTRGTVLIDEVDLHLHPSLQATLLNALHRAFPCLQFIATTHAPLVMSGVRHSGENRVYKMNYSLETGYTIVPIETYGMDMSGISQIVLNVTPRDKGVDAQLKQLFDEIDSEQYEKARETLAQLREEFNDRIPELTRAETLLDVLE